MDGDPYPTSDVGLPDLAHARVKSGDQLLSVSALAAAVRTLCWGAAAAFVITVGIGAVAPTWGLAIANAFRRMYLAPGYFLGQYLSAQATITLANSLAALGASILGALGALLVARVQGRDATARRSYGVSGRAAYAVVSSLCAVARKAAPALGQAKDMGAQASAAIAVLAPRLSVACSGCAVGTYLAGSLLQGWIPHVLRVAVGLLPHGVFELPAMLASAALGIAISERLVAAAQLGLPCVHDTARQLITSGPLLRILALIVAVIVIGAAIEVRTM
jgi:hypothetical protein